MTFEELKAIAARRLALVTDLEDRLARMVFKVSDLYQENEGLRAENAKMHAVVEAARIHVKNGGMKNAQALADALAALEGT